MNYDVVDLLDRETGEILRELHKTVAPAETVARLEHDPSAGAAGTKCRSGSLPYDGKNRLTRAAQPAIIKPPGCADILKMAVVN